MTSRPACHNGSAESACSGKCMQSCATATPQLWVAVAYGGMVCLLKRDDTGLSCLPHRQDAPPFSPQELATHLQHAVLRQEFSQLILVGAPNDVRWLHASIPADVAGRIVAEIPHHIEADWLKESGLTRLIASLRPLFL